jgi:2,4-dienoyl-CoA reductase-like NADH-dependent reductase (Old Yellow Enzyme family)
LKTLFDETRISNMNLKNRFIRSAIWEGLADETGHVTNELINHYQELAMGGVGTIITGFANVMRFDKPTNNMNGIYDDSFIDEYRVLTSRIHEYDANIIMQIVHGGPKWAPSEVEHLALKTIPKKMNLEDIEEVVQAFGDAAFRVKKAGFDGVQLHAAHGFLLSMFLNPYYNRRSDDYGGSIGNRARIIFESYISVRDAVGDDFPVLLKVNAEDFMDEGLTSKDSLYVCKALSEMGVNLIEVSGGSFSSMEGKGPIRSNVNSRDKEAYFKDYAVNIAEEVDVPVALVGGNRSMSCMDEILNNSKIEYFSIARPLIREPNLINRWQRGNTEPALCVSCSSGCNGVKNGCRFNL